MVLPVGAFQVAKVALTKRKWWWLMQKVISRDLKEALLRREDLSLAARVMIRFSDRLAADSRKQFRVYRTYDARIVVTAERFPGFLLYTTPSRL